MRIDIFGFFHIFTHVCCSPLVTSNTELVMVRTIVGREVGRPVVRGACSLYPNRSNFPIEFTSGEGRYSHGYTISLDVISSELPSLTIDVPDRFSFTLSVGHGSPFATLVGSLITMPVNPDSLGPGIRMIASPSDPLSYSSQRSMIMVPVSRVFSYTEAHQTDRVGFQAEVRLIGSSLSLSDNSSRLVIPNESFEGTFALSAQDMVMEFPSEITRFIGESIRSEGFGLITPRYLDPGCAELLPRLPSIQLSFRNTPGTIVFTPDDYIEFIADTDDCLVLINLNDEPRADGYYSLGQAFLQRIGVFLDYNNDQIGFFEPL